MPSHIRVAGVGSGLLRSRKRAENGLILLLLMFVMSMPKSYFLLSVLGQHIVIVLDLETQFVLGFFLRQRQKDLSHTTVVGTRG